MAAPQNSFTDFPNGVTSFGIPLPASGKLVTSTFGRTWFVNASSSVPNAGWGAGSDGNSGTSPTSPFLTMAKAFSVIGSGDSINFVGKITEQLVTPVQIFDIWINGCGNLPRHADAVPAGGGYAAAQWAAPSTGTVGQATLRVLQQGWRFTNFLFTARDSTAACVEVVRDAGAGNAERDASHASFYGMRFSGAGIGIKAGVAALFTEIVNDVHIKGCQFDNMTTAISDGIGTNQWTIEDNVFLANTNQVIMKAGGFCIRRNSIGAFTAAANSGGVDLNGGAGLNQVTGNNLSGTYSIAGGYRVANANDNWYGNATSAGFSSADPA